jgi:predicted RNA-binding protein with PIN domain
VAEPTLYLFDGYNVLHAGAFEDVRALVDRLASFVALKGARGVVVFDGVGRDESIGPLDVRYAPHADALLERLAAEHRAAETVALVSSDAAVRGTSGHEVVKIGSARFAGELSEPAQPPEPADRISHRLDDETRARLEDLRRGG